MPRASHRMVLELSLRKRPAEIRAGLAESKNPHTFAHQQDGHSVRLDPAELVFLKLSFRKHQNKIGRGRKTGGMIDADPLFVYQMAAKISRNIRNNISEERDLTARAA